MALTLTTPPAEEPLTLAEAKDHLRVDAADDDALIMALVVAARLACEASTGRALITQGWTLWLDAWPAAREPRWWDGVREAPVTKAVATTVRLPRPPLQSVALVAVWSAADEAATLSPTLYQVDTASVPGRLVARPGAIWPLPGRAANGIEIRFTAGYGTAAADVPAALRQGMLAHVARLYEERGDGEPGALPAATLALYRPYTLPRF